MNDTTPQYPIRQFRLQTGLTIRELEARTGINRGRLSIIERGVTPTPDESKAILAAFTEKFAESLREEPA